MWRWVAIDRWFYGTLLSLNTCDRLFYTSRPYTLLSVYRYRGELLLLMDTKSDKILLGKRYETNSHCNFNKNPMDNMECYLVDLGKRRPLRQHKAESSAQGRGTNSGRYRERKQTSYLLEKRWTSLSSHMIQCIYKLEEM